MIKTTALALLAAGSMLTGTVAFAQDAAMNTTTTTTTHAKKMAKPHKARTMQAKKTKTAK